jgi:hypothetical protein
VMPVVGSVRRTAHRYRPSWATKINVKKMRFRTPWTPPLALPTSRGHFHIPTLSLFLLVPILLILSDGRRTTGGRVMTETLSLSPSLSLSLSLFLSLSLSLSPSLFLSLSLSLSLSLPLSLSLFLHHHQCRPLCQRRKRRRRHFYQVHPITHPADAATLGKERDLLQILTNNGEKRK